jgi:hypothetical protein
MRSKFIVSWDVLIPKYLISRFLISDPTAIVNKMTCISNDHVNDDEDDVTSSSSNTSLVGVNPLDVKLDNLIHHINDRINHLCVL